MYMLTRSVHRIASLSLLEGAGEWDASKDVLMPLQT